MATFTRPVAVGQCLEQPCELVVLSHDGVQKPLDRLAADQTRASIALLVEISEDRCVFVEEAPDPEPVDLNNDIAQVGQCLERGPLSFPRRVGEHVRRRGFHRAPHEARRRPHPLKDRAMLRAHGYPCRFSLCPVHNRLPSGSSSRNSVRLAGMLITGSIGMRRFIFMHSPVGVSMPNASAQPPAPAETTSWEAIRAAPSVAADCSGWADLKIDDRRTHSRGVSQSPGCSSVAGRSPAPRRPPAGRTDLPGATRPSLPGALSRVLAALPSSAPFPTPRGGCRST